MPHYTIWRSTLLSLAFGAWASLACAQAPRMVNLSTLGQVGAGGNAMVSGFVIGAGSGETVLIRAVGPTLGAPAPGGFGVAGALSDPVLTLSTSGTQLAVNSAWSSGTAATMASVGAFPLLSGSKDAAIVASLSPGKYTAQVTSASGGSGSAILEIYEVGATPSSSRLINLSTLLQVTSGTVATSGLFVSPGSGSRTLLIRGVGPTLASFGVAGSLADPALTVLDSSHATIATNDDWGTPIGANAANGSALSAAASQSGAFPLSQGSRDAALIATVSPGSYSIQMSGNAGGSGMAMVEVYDITGSNGPGAAPTLYVANLAPASGATSSTASGTATIYLAADGSSATINISFSNLSSGEQAPHLTLGAPGSSSNFVFNLSYPGQVVNDVWTFTATGGFSSSDMIGALKAGNIYVEIGSANYPAGELVGQFIAGSGSQTFSPPAAPPAIDLSTVTPTDAARFLTQATFGPTTSDIASLPSTGYAAWIASQMALPASSHLAATRADAAAFPNSGQYPVTANNRQAAWWKTVVNAPDQLRQRVAFALSEIFVVSDAASSLANQPEALANYYDMLARDSFGSFRQLLQDVTLSPVMGNYLNMLRSRPANPVTGTSADENYAREIMQLFTIGLNQLNPDGSLKLDASGQPIPTYDNTTIVQTANVFTGWAYNSTATNPSFGGGAADWYNPMMLYPAYHDNTKKTIVGGVVLPANEGGAADLKAELDTLANHPNTGPFICRELIQRLVTSNPSPGYIYRVAQVFANDGTGTRGSLGAVVKAILLDYEARSLAVISNAGYGKLKEPLLRQTAVYRAFNATSQNGRYAIFGADQTLAQAAVRSPTVFNFFLPNFVPAGTMAAAGLFGPEFQITTASTAITTANTLYNSVYTPTTPGANTLVLDLSSLTSAPNNAAMVATLNLLFGGNSMSAAATQRIITALAALPSTTLPSDRAKAALELVVTAPGGAVQQ